MFDPGTAAGLGVNDIPLTPGVVAVDPAVHPYGTIFRDTNSGQVYVAADKHGNTDPNVVDFYTHPQDYSRESGTKNLMVIGQVPLSAIPKTAAGIQRMLSGFQQASQAPQISVQDGQVQLPQNADWTQPGTLNVSEHVAQAPSPTDAQTDEFGGVPVAPIAAAQDGGGNPGLEGAKTITLQPLTVQPPSSSEIPSVQMQAPAGRVPSSASPDANQTDEFGGIPVEVPNADRSQQPIPQTSQDFQALGAQYQQQAAQRTGKPSADLSPDQLEHLGRSAWDLQQQQQRAQLEDSGATVDQFGGVAVPTASDNAWNAVKSMAGSAVENTLAAIQGMYSQASMAAAKLPGPGDAIANEYAANAAKLADLRASYAQVYKQDPSFSNSFTGHLTSAIGGSAPQFLEAVIPGGVLAMQSQGFQNAWEDAQQSAERNGTSFNPTKAFWYAQAMGAVNAIAQKAKFDAAFKGWLAKGGGSVLGQSLRHGLLAAGMGAVITPTQTVAQNIAARYMGIDPHRQLLDPKNLGEQALIGALLGLPMGAAGGASHAMEQGAKLRTLQGAAALKNFQIKGSNVDPALVHAAFGGGAEAGADSRFAPKEAPKGSPVSVSSSWLGSITDSNIARKAARAWWRKNHAETIEVAVPGFPEKVKISLRNIKHGTSQGNQFAEAATVPYLEKILPTAEKSFSEPDRRGRAEIKQVHHLMADVMYDGSPARLGIVVRETNEGHFYYDHTYLKDEPPGIPGDWNQKSDSQSFQPAEGSQDNLGSPDPLVKSQPVFATSEQAPAPDPSLVRAVVDKVTGGWRNAPPVLVIDDMNKLSSYYDPSTMASIRNGKTEAFYDPNAHAVVMLPENFQPAPGESMESFVSRKIIHEIVGHAGLRGLFTGEMAGQYHEIMGHAFDHLSGQDFGSGHGDLHGYRTLSDLARGYGFDLSTPEGRSGAVEEHMARVAETAHPPAWYHRVIAAISELIRKMGFSHWTNSDTHTLLDRARNQVAGLPEPEAQSKIAFSKMIDEAKESPEKQRGFIASAKAAAAVEPTVKERLQGVYRPISNAETVAAARQAINTRGIDGTLTDLLGNKAPSAADYASGIELISRLQAAGRHEDTSALIEHMASSATDQGRAIQSLSLLSKLTPEGIQVYAQKLVNKVIDKSPGLKGAAAAVGGMREKLSQARHGEATAALVNLQDRISDMLGMKNPGSLWGRYRDQAVGQLESKLLPGAPHAPVPLEDFTAHLTKMLKEKLPSSGPRAQRPQLSDAELIGEAVRNFDKYKEVWTAAQDAIRQKYGADSAALGSMDDFLGAILDKPFSDASVTRAAQAALKDLNLTMRQVLTQSVGDKAKTLKALKDAIIQKAKLSGPDAEKLATEVQAAFQREHQAARDSLLRQMLADRSHAIPRSALEKLLGLNNAGALDDVRFFGALAKQYGIPVWTPELSAKVQRLQREYERATDPEMKLVKGAQMFDAVHSLVPVDGWARIHAVQNISMLLNPKTMIRNVLGNAVLWAADLGADSVSRWVVDPLVSIATGNRTRSSVEVAARLSGLAQPVRDFWNGYQFAKDAGASRKESIAEGVRTLLTLAQLTSRKSLQITDLKRVAFNTLSSPAGKLLEDGLSLLNGAGDRAFWAAAFKADLARQMKLAADRGESLVAPTPEMVAESMEAAGKAVFQDDNFLSKGMRDLQKGLNRISTLGFSDQWGLGSLIMSFTQIPGSIAMRGVEWSPLGFIRSASELIKPTLRGAEFNQKDFVDSFSRATAGTAILSLGYYLAKIGIVTALGEEDKDLNAMQQAAGLGKYRINVSALNRALTTGNWVTPQIAADGDITVNYDWLQPNAMALAAGAEIAHRQQINRAMTEQGKISKVVGSGMVGIIAGTKALQDQPLLSGLSDYAHQVSFNGIGGGTAITLLKAPTAFIPTFIAQVNQLMSNQVRETQAGSPWDKAVAQIMTKLPGLSERYPAKYDAFGQALEKYHYGGNSLFNVLVNPAFVDKVNMTPALREVQRVYAASGDVRIAPPQAPVRLNLAGQQVELTNEQISQYQRLSGTMILNMYNRLAASPQFAEASMLAKSETMAKVVGLAGNITKLQVLQGNPDLINKLRGELLQTVDAKRGLLQVK